MGWSSDTGWNAEGGWGRPPSGAPTYDTDAATLFAAWATAGVPADATRKGLVNTFILALKSAGTWTKSDSIYVFKAHAQAAALTNWKDPAQSMSVNGSVTFNTDSGFNPTTTSISNYLLMPELLDAAGNVYALNDAHYSTYLNAYTFKPGGAVVTSGGANYNSCLGQPSATNNFETTINNATRFGTGTDATASHYLGMWTASRTGSTASALYKSGAAVNGLNSWTDSTVSTTTPLTAPKLLWGDGSVAFFPPDIATRMSYYSTGSSFTSGNASDEAAAYGTYATAVGGI